MQVTFRPIVTWPGESTRRRKHSRFRAGYSDTLRLLDIELVKLQARDVVIELWLSESEIRLDGMPRSGSRPRSPGVILSFISRYGPLRYLCDSYGLWEDNLRAIALSLEALRAVDRHGMSSRGEQYTGWKALPVATANGVIDSPARRREVDERTGFPVWL